MRFEQKLLDFDSMEEGYFAEFLLRNQRIFNFMTEKKIFLLFRNFLNKYRGKVRQKGLEDRFAQSWEEEEEKKIWSESKKKGENLKEEKSARNGEEEKIRAIIEDIQKKKRREIVEMIRKKRENIRNIPEKFNFWAYQKKKEKRADLK